MELPGQLKRHRTQSGLSQEDVASKIYVSRQTVSNWETGKTYPDVQSLLLLSNLFGVSIDELVKGDLADMKNKVKEDSRTLTRLGWAMLGFMLATLACGGAAIVVRDIGPMTDDGFSVASAACMVATGVLFLCGFAAAVWAEVLKRQNDLVTYKEIVAFEKGDPAGHAKDDDAFGRKHPVLSLVAKVLLGAGFGFIAVMVFVIVAKYLRDFVFQLLG